MSRIVFTGVDVGDQKRVRCVFVDEAGATKDATVIVRLIDPDGVKTTPSVAHEGIADSGTYSFVQTYSKPLVWYGRFEASGALIDAVEFEVRVNSTPFYP